MSNFMTPFLSSLTVGFDHFDNLFEQLSKIENNPNPYPPYNIEKIDNNKYRISMALAGFNENNIDISQDGRALTICGQVTEEEKKKEKNMLYKGIATRSFSRKFELETNTEVKEAKFKDGMLVIELFRLPPDNNKPKKIKITKT